jgi:excisionase family DNA binding protein
MFDKRIIVKLVNIVCQSIITCCSKQLRPTGGTIYMRDDEKILITQKLAYSVDEASQLTGLSKGYFRKIIKAGELKVTRAGRRVLILDSHLREWLTRNLRRA